MDIKRLIRSELVTMKSYAPVEPTDVLSRRAELSAGRIVKLDGNENPYGCSPQVSQALATYPYYHNYPDPEQRDLRKALEEYTGLGRQHIVCGMGSDELIDLILRLLLRPGDEVINCPPTFGMYPFSTEVCGGSVVDVPRTSDFSLDMTGIKEAVTGKTKVIFVASPNNPTGNTTPAKDIMELVATGKVVVVDEAYFEFSDASVANLVPSYPNLIVLRTFSKWAGLAGLRVGYGVFPARLMEQLWKIKQPYNVSVAASAAALAALDARAWLEEKVALIVQERERLAGLLADVPYLWPYPSRANFTLCQVVGRDARELKLALEREGILIRYFDKPRLRDHIRISIGQPGQTDALLAALRRL
jgi:histidinol-phosphate aminotransferase